MSSSASSTSSGGTASFISHTGLTKTGPGILDLADGNKTAISDTYSGPLTVDGGLVMLKADSNLGAAPATFNPAAIVLNGGELRTSAGFTINTNRGITVGPQGGAFSYVGGSTLVLAQVITGPGGMTFRSIGNPTNYQLNNTTTDTYQGPTYLDASNNASNNITWEHDETLPNGTAVTVIQSQTNLMGFINLNNHNQTIGSLASSGTIGNIENIGVLTLGGTASNPVTQSAVYGGAIAGTGRIVKNGGGIQTFSGSNTYTGGTQINGGAIVVTNTSISALGSGTVGVNSGGILGGTGIVGGAVTVFNGGEIQPTVVGNGASTLQLKSNLTLNSGSILGFNLGAINSGTNPIASPTSDNIYVTGNLNLAAGADTINIAPVGSGLVVPGTYPLITAAGSVPANLNGITFTVNGPLTDLYAVSLAGQSLDLTITANPNPFIKWVARRATASGI